MRCRFRRDIGREEGPAGAAVIADLIEFARREPRVGDGRPGVETARREQQTGKRNAIFAHDHHAVAGADAEREQRIRGPTHRAVEFAIGHGRAIVGQRRAIRRRRGMTVHDLVNTVGQAVVNAGRRGLQFERRQ